MANSKDNIEAYATSFIGFDENGGNVYDNISGYIGTIYNNPARVVGWNGEGYTMSFNGSNQYVQFSDKVIPIGAKSIRFKIKTTLSTGYSIIMTQTAGSAYSGTQIALDGGKIAFILGQGVANKPIFSVTSNIAISDGNWHDIYCTWDGTINANSVKLYIDGMITPNVEGTAISVETNVPTYNLIVAKSNVANTPYYFNGQLDQIEIYDGVISPIPDKYLIFHNNEYKYHDGTSWQITTAIEDNFIKYGMNQLSQITETQWQELSGDISIVMWSDFEDKQYMNVVLERDPFTAKDVIGDEYDILVLNSEQANPQQLLLDAVANPQIIYPTGDIPLFGIKELTSVNVTATGNGRIAISVDSGVTWNKLNGDTWDVITDIADGMTFVEFNALTGEQLEALKGDSNTIRFAYYLTGDTEVDRIELRISMAGTPEFANKDDYDMSYDATTKTITYDIKKSGHYLVNYVNT